jgi:hypothetical protein
MACSGRDRRRTNQITGSYGAGYCALMLGPIVLPSPCGWTPKSFAMCERDVRTCHHTWRTTRDGLFGKWNCALMQFVEMYEIRGSEYDTLHSVTEFIGSFYESKVFEL